LHFSECVKGSAWVPEGEIFSKKGYLLSFKWEKTNFTTFAPLEKSPRGSDAARKLGKHPSTCRPHRQVSFIYTCQYLLCEFKTQQVLDIFTCALCGESVVSRNRQQLMLRSTSPRHQHNVPACRTQQ